MSLLPVHRPAELVVSSAAMQYRMPARPLACPCCGYRQVWEMPVSRYLSTPPPATGPSTADPTELPERPDEPPPPALWSPPPGWGLVFCRLCGALCVLVLRKMPDIGLLSPPALLELSTVRLSYSVVQYRLPDHPSSGEERWRLALVAAQHDRRTLDLAVRLVPSDPEYHEQLLSTLRLVELRLDDVDGAERWRPALVAGRPGEGGALNLTVTLDPTDPEGARRGFDRRVEAIRGDQPGQWRYPNPAVVVERPVLRAGHGQRHGQWLPINNT